MKKLSALPIVIIFLICACNTTPKPKEEVFEPSLKSPSVSLGEAEMQFDRAFPLPGIRKLTVAVSYFPAEDAVCLRWRMDFITHYLFLNHDSREKFISSYIKYKDDFDERNFGKSSRKSKRQYGTSNGYVIWQTASFTIQAKAPSVLDYGYFFVDKAPYFTVTQRKVEYLDPLSRDNNRQLTPISIYFTRTQAEALAEFFDEERLANASVVTPPRIMDIEFDEY